MEQSTSLTLNKVTSHFKAWRAKRVGKSRIPAHLWQEATDLYPSYTISEITKTLRLGASDFKKKISQSNHNLAQAEFIRIDQTPTIMDITATHQQENDNQTTTIELEKGDGSRIRIQRELNNQALLSIVTSYFGESSCCS
jgi:hypothetical protein